MCGLLAHPERATGPIPTGRPRFSWIVPLTEKDDLQTAYQVQVFGANKSSVWDSGRVASADSVAVAYGGAAPLAPGTGYSWQVRTWNRRGKASEWSERQGFAVGEATPDSDGVRTTVARYRLERRAVRPVRVTHPEKERAFLDFGRSAFAGLTLTLTAPNDATTVTVHLGEAADGETVRRMPGGSVRHHQVEIPLQAGTHEYVVPLTKADARRMPAEIGPVMPFRYVEIEGLHAPLAAADAVQQVVHYPFETGAARFASSDAGLDAVWELCRYSIEATTFCGVYVDGDRERLPYEADAYINQLGHYCTDREFTLARYSQEHLIQKPTWPTEWYLFSVMCAWEDYRHSSDPDSLHAFYDDLAAKTLFALARPDGLISTVEPPVPEAVARSVQHLPTVRKIEDIVDWPPAERDGYEMRPVNTVVNAFFCYALEAMAGIAEAVGRKEEVAVWRGRAAKAKTALNAALFDTEAGLYRDGEGSMHHSLHANAFPLAFGLVPADRVGHVGEWLAGRGMVCSVYGAQFLLEALYNAGRGDAALALLTAKDDRGWLHMRDAVGSTITLEAWDRKYKPNLDWNHAWGAAPANIIPRRLMGVEPLEPGFHRVRVRPQPGNLTHAAVTVPTVRGPIRVAFDARNPARFVLDIDVPANMTAEVYLPALAGTPLLVDGKRQAGESAEVGGGSHRIERVKKAA